MNVPPRLSHIDIAKSIPFITLTMGLVANLVTVVWFAATMSANLEKLTDKVLILEQQYSSADRADSEMQTRVVRIEEQAKHSNGLLQEIRSDLRDLVKRLEAR